MFPILYYEYDSVTVILYAKILLTDSLVHRLGYHEAILSITQGYHKTIILLLLHYQCMNCHTCKYKFPFHIIFWFLMSWVSNTYNIYICIIIELVICITSTVFFIILENIDVGTEIHLVNRWHKRIVSIITVQYCKCNKHIVSIITVQYYKCIFLNIPLITFSFL